MKTTQKTCLTYVSAKTYLISNLLALTRHNKQTRYVCHMPPRIRQPRGTQNKRAARFLSFGTWQQFINLL